MTLNTYRVERKAADEAVFLLPVPPSTNNLFWNVPGKGRVCTTKYNDWKREAMLMIMQQRVGRVSGRIKILIEINNVHQRRDLDNFAKPTQDILADKRINVIDGDSGKYVRELTIRWAPIKDVQVTITRAE